MVPVAMAAAGISIMAPSLIDYRNAPPSFRSDLLFAGGRTEAFEAAAPILRGQFGLPLA
jgi:hypothetical protein